MLLCCWYFRRPPSQVSSPHLTELLYLPGTDNSLFEGPGTYVSMTEQEVSMRIQPLWLLIGFALVLLWFNLLIHLTYDGWRVLPGDSAPRGIVIT